MIKHTKYKFKHHLRCFIIFNVGTVFNQVLLSVQLGATTCSLGNAPTALLYSISTSVPINRYRALE